MTKTPAGRRHVDDKRNLPVFAGSLRDELQSHALQRAEFFFYFLITMKIVVAEINRQRARLQQPSLPDAHFVLAKATDQIGTGMRSADEVTYSEFNPKDEKVVDKPTTMFTRADAAHFCNLGLALSFAEACRATAFTRDGYERLKVHAGATKLLPQQVNIGPDRVLDVMHAELAPRMLGDGGLIFTRDRVATYRSTAVAALEAYEKEKRAAGFLGLAACTQCYLDMYASKDFEGRVFRRVYPEVVGLCESSPVFRGQSHLFYR
jgi:hypothetical protein